jgi:1-acyl-sn-glycerol-3-phosphate acyltransferase
MPEVVFPKEKTRMTKFFLLVYDYFSQHKILLFALSGLLIVLFAGMAFHLRFKEDISGFLPENRENERINNAYRYVASANKITVFCSAPDSTDRATEMQIEAVERLAGRLQSSLDSSYIRHLFFKVEPSEMAAITSFVANNMPYFLDEADYLRMDSLFSGESIAAQLKNDRDVLLSPVGMVMKEHILADPLRITGPVMKKLQDFRIGDQFHLYHDHIFTNDREALLLIECAMPVSETARNAGFIDSLHLYMAEVERAMEGNITLHSFGASEIATGNAAQIKKDTVFSSLIAFILIFALLIYAFRDARKIVLIFVPALFGGLFALAFLYLIRGEVSIIAVGISSIMFGIAINYPLHFVGHYNHTPHPRSVIREIIEPLTIGNITTVGAFLSLVFTGSEAMSDLGWFASLLLIGTILFVLLFLPHLMPPHKVRMPERALFFRFTGIAFEKNRRIVWTVLALTLFFGFFCRGTRFETNMQKINYMTDSQQKEYRRMTELLNVNRHILYYVTEGETLDEALEAGEAVLPALHALMDEGRITKIGGIGRFYPSRARQAERAERWNGFWQTRKDSVCALLNGEARKAGFSPDAFRAFEEAVNRRWTPAGRSHFDLIRETLAGNYLIDTGGKSMIVNLLYTDAAGAQELEEVLNRLSDSSISFDAGSITRRMIAALSDNFNYVLYVCGLIVFIFLVFSLGRLELGIIAFMPLALSWIWILGLMHVFDIRFNIVNIILATFIFGQGDDYTIFITEGLMYEYTYRRKILASYKNSIALSALIMFTGMGMLIFARHPALHSLAEVTIAGMLSVVIMSYIIPPLLFQALVRRGGKKRLMPVTLKNLFATLFAFFFFLFASAAITVFGRLLFAFGRSPEKDRRYHRLLCRVAGWVIFRVPQVRTTCSNLSGETFEKPSVIICNHQSHLDLMCIMMLTPRLIILTNDWAWRSPFYGRLIRYAGFYPVSDGIENMLGQLREMVRQGYSIAVFPEGTRSADCSILRFHRGAFYLAAQLQLDIVPVLIHGAGHVLPRQELMLRKGEIHIRVMNRITPGDARFSPDYSLRSREVRRFYREQYRDVCRQVETPAYYGDRVLHNYIYKGLSVERAVRGNLRRHQHFAALIARLPDEGSVRVINSGYGEFTLMLSLVKKQLQIVGVEKDPDLRDIAANCASVPANLRYVEDESILADEPADVLVVIEKNMYTITNSELRMES